jgi:hypothetical protein
VAARRGYAELAEVLIAAGADVNAGTPLAAAIEERHSDVARALIRTGMRTAAAPA